MNLFKWNVVALFLLLITNALHIPSPVSAQYTGVDAPNNYAEDIERFFAAGSDAYLAWQYSGDSRNPTENDPYSFFKGGETCQILDRANDAHPGKIGVNIYNFHMRYQASNVDGRSVPGVDLNYLKNSCGTTIIRFFGTSNPDAVIGALATLKANGMTAVLALSNFAIDSNLNRVDGDYMPFFREGYKTQFREYARSLTARIVSEGYTDTIYALELSNEPHCGSLVNCVPDYKAWADDMAGVLTSTGFPSSKLSTGQMAAYPDGRADNPSVGLPGLPVDYLYTNEKYGKVSGHHYDARSIALNLVAVSVANSAGKTFYVGEAAGGNAEMLPPVNWDRLTKPCNFIASPEYHGLRPYPFNPCDPLIPKRAELTFQCGNALDSFGSRSFPTVRQGRVDELALFPGTATTLPADPPLHIPSYPGDGTIGLYQKQNRIYAVQRIPFDVEVELNTAQIPVVGNTQLNLDDATSMNNYLSWYLNGTFEQSNRRPANSDDQLINFSGPLKKLFAQSSQRQIRQVVISGVSSADVHNYLTGNLKSGPRMTQITNALDPLFRNIPLSNVEDVVGELTIVVQPDLAKQPNNGVGTGELNGRSQMYIPEPNRNANAMKLYIKRSSSPGGIPTGEVGSDGRMYLSHLRETLSLSSMLRDYALPKKGKSGVPLGPAVVGDAKKYFLGTPDKDAHKGIHDQTVVQFSQENAAYGETATRNTEIIDNAYGRVIALMPGEGQPRELSGIAQDTGDDRNPKNALAPEIAMPKYEQVTPGEIMKSENSMCSLQAIDIPGDNVTDSDGWQVAGRMTYTGIFSYDPIPDPCGLDADTAACNGRTGRCKNDSSRGCGDHWECHVDVDYTLCNLACAGTPDEGKCQDDCIDGQLENGSCKPKERLSISTAARTTVVTETPFVSNIYEKLISSSTSVMRRFLPQETVGFKATNTCSDEFLRGEEPGLSPKSNPIDSCVKNASTNVYYESKNGSESAKHPNGAGGNSRQLKTIYFPYLGSLYDYFLGAGNDPLNFQKMFRPQGFTSAQGNAVGQAPPPPPSPIGTSRCAPSTMATCTPAGLTAIFGAFAEEASRICQAESGGNPLQINKNCPDYSVGLFQINLFGNRVPAGVNPKYPAGLDCPAAFSNGQEINHGDFGACATNVIVNQTLLDQCVEHFSNDQYNKMYAYNKFAANGFNWGRKTPTSPIMWSTYKCIPRENV